MSNFVGRRERLETLSSWLKENPKDKLCLISVEGPGGVGKTTLIRQALKIASPREHGFLDLRLDGRHRDQDAITALVTMVRRASDQLPGDYRRLFPRITRLQRVNDALESAATKRAMADIDRVQSASAQDLKNAVRALIDAGRILGDIAPKTKEHVNFEGLSSHADNIDAIIDNVAGTLRRTEASRARAASRVWRVLRRDTALRDQLLHSPGAVIAEAFISDLASVLSNPSHTGRAKPHGHQGSGLARPSQLFLFIDDYEAYQDTFGEKLLLREMIGRLETAPFKSTILVSGRDSLGKSHPDWIRNFPLLQDTTMSLKPLREDDIYELLLMRNLDGDVHEITRTMYQETEGYPLLIDYALEELAEGELSALSLKAFFDRQAQWMTQRQRMWLQHICFAEVVNHESIRRLLPDEDPGEVFNWFKSEGSIRDTSGSEFRMRPFVRARILRFVQISDPAAYETMSRLAHVPSAGE